MFTTQVYANASPMQPAPARPISDLQLRAELLVTLVKRFGLDVTSIRQGLALYDDPALKKVVPDPRLRAGLAMMKGTVGEAAISAFRNGTFSTVVFGVPPANGFGLDVIAQSIPDGNKMKVVFNDTYQYENPKLLGTTLCHEGLHQDTLDSNKEELIANAIESVIYGQLANDDEGLARSKTELARRENTKLMALVNSRDANGAIHILSSNTDNVYPGSSNPLPYFGYGFVSAGLGADTPGNPVLRADLFSISKTASPNANFDMSTLNFLDQKINIAFRPSEWIRLAKIMKLDVGN
jgi:hypothetical protein